MNTDRLAAALNELVTGLEDDPTCLASGESVVDLHVQLARMKFVVSASAASFDSCAAWSVDGARSAQAWIATSTRLPSREIREELCRGRAARQLPAFARSWAEGRTGGAHLAEVAAIRTDRTAQAIAENEELLVGHAERLPFDQFRRVVAYTAQLADPDGSERDYEALRAERRVSLQESFRGNWLGEINLDPIAGSIVARELDRLEHELYEAERARVAAELGREPLKGELERTASQRRADALVKMATRSAATPDDAPRSGPLFSIFVGYESLHGRICELANGRVIPPGALLPYLDGAQFERVVFRPQARVEVSARARLFSGATRRAIECRDRRCQHPFCDLPADKCQADHIVPYPAGGPTTQENGRLLCPFHNRLAYREWVAAGGATGPPSGDDPADPGDDPTDPGDDPSTWDVADGVDPPDPPAL